MKLLLDTHVLLWSLIGSPALSRHGAALLASNSDDLMVSAVSIWEIAIKHALRRGRPDDMPISGGQALEEITGAGFEMLTILGRHAAAVGRLPRLHGDPFDRMLIAQALSESLLLVTSDQRLCSYGEFVRLVRASPP